MHEILNKIHFLLRALLLNFYYGQGIIIFIDVHFWNFQSNHNLIQLDRRLWFDMRDSFRTQSFENNLFVIMR